MFFHISSQKRLFLTLTFFVRLLTWNCPLFNIHIHGESLWSWKKQPDRNSMSWTYWFCLARQNIYKYIYIFCVAEQNWSVHDIECLSGFFFHNQRDSPRAAKQQTKVSYIASCGAILPKFNRINHINRFAKQEIKLLDCLAKALEPYTVDTNEAETAKSRECSILTVWPIFLSYHILSSLFRL